MSAPINLSRTGQRAAREHLDPNDYWDLNAKWKVESRYITEKAIPQFAVDTVKNATGLTTGTDLSREASEAWRKYETDLKPYCGGEEKEDNKIFDMAKRDLFRNEAPTSGAVIRMLILFWVAASCELTVFVVQGIFSGGFNPIIVLLAILLAFGGFLSGSGIGKMLFASWSNSFLQEPRTSRGVEWSHLILGLTLVLAVAAIRAYGAGELIPGAFAFLITLLLGVLCALFETLHELLKLKREECLLRQGQAQTWTANATHLAILSQYREIFDSQVRQRWRVGGNVIAPPVEAAKLTPLIHREAGGNRGHIAVPPDPTLSGDPPSAPPIASTNTN